MNRQQYIRNWQRNKRDAIAKIPDPKKMKCLVCNQYYMQVGSHVIQTHKYDTARQYREEFSLEVKKGITSNWYRKLKGKLALENGTYKNLKKGEKFRFKKGVSNNYKRSPITLKRLSNLHKLKK